MIPRYPNQLGFFHCSYEIIWSKSMNGPVVFVPSVPNHQQPPRHAFVVGRLVVGYALWMQAGFTCLGPPTTKPQAKPWTKKNQNTWPGPLWYPPRDRSAWSMAYFPTTPKTEGKIGKLLRNLFFWGGGQNHPPTTSPLGWFFLPFHQALNNRNKVSISSQRNPACVCSSPRGGLANKQSIVFGMIHTNSAAHREGYRGTYITIF